MPYIKIINDRKGVYKVERHLYRSRSNKVIAGVCGGFAEYFGVDPTIVRLIWVLVTLTYGLGLIAYIIAAIIIPEGGFEGYNQGQYGGQFSEGSSEYNKPVRQDNRTNVIIGGVLILIGLGAVARRYFHWIDFSLLWPVLLIIIGGLIIFRGWRK